MKTPRRSTLLASAVLAAGLVVAGTSTAGAATGNGAWDPLSRCPVDAPAMLAADGASTAAICLASHATSGSMTIGRTTVPTGAVDLQIGVLRTGSTYAVVAPAKGTVVADPVSVPGGLLGIMCGDPNPLIDTICRGLAGSPLNVVTATVEAAGDPSEFNLTSGLTAGKPILKLPVKIHLRNVLLGTSCYLGSDSDPIVLQPRNTARPTATLTRFDPDGTLSSTGIMGYLAISGTDQTDTTFTVPGANGCGLLGILNGAVNDKLGLPSASGSNALTLTAADTSFGGFYTPNSFAPTEGQQLSTRWHAAFRG
ncbi:MAG TPA: hypothetical protein VJT49_12570 [Amycolatopsis sp.]|uniref:hypothetical protein n=1 Tax=Amycolatopsis sp. TaxID=37632 RepID=UPI002B48F752|nr:hypothetical protein [Amycolatopsis sp.]HKS45922.1 hypothetical protein [Amycolatopsis sp.]